MSSTHPEWRFGIDSFAPENVERPFLTMGHINRLEKRSQEFCYAVVNVRRLWWRDSLFHNAYVFSYFYDAVARDVFEVLHHAARPANLDAICPGGFAQPEVQAEVTL